MKKLVLAAFLISSIGHADVIECDFTEPFIITSYDILQKTLTRKDVSEAQPTVIKNVTLVVTKTGVIELSQNGKVLQTLTLNGEGSNGMGEHKYLYHVQDYLMNGANNGFGGCSRYTDIQ